MKNFQVKVSIKQLACTPISNEQAARVKGGNSEGTDGTEIVIVDSIVS